MIIWLLAAALALPNPQLTPGAVRPLTYEQICKTTKWGLDKRLVDDRMKRHVLAAYGYTWEDRGKFEIDHLVPRSLSGRDDILDLWPQPLWEAKHLKDPAEQKIWKLYCAGGITLAAAQKAFMTDWRAAYVEYVGPLP